MPQRSKGPRLYLRRASGPTGAVWIIRDGGHRESTRCGPDDLAGATAALRAYLERKHVAQAAAGSRRSHQIPVADVIALYARDVAPSLASPREAARRLGTLLDYWGSKTLAEVAGPACRDYVATRGRPQAARRELEDLRAAIRHHRNEGLCSEVVEVALPAKAPGRERYLTRSEAAALVWSAWRYREVQNLRGTERHTRRHLARLILVGLYTGTRPGTIIRAALRPEAGRPWFDLSSGIFYRRPDGARATKKRQPPVRVPDRLLAHLRRWKRLGQRYVVEFNGRPVQRVHHAWRAATEAAGLGPEVTPHVLRHTAITWAMMGGAELYQAAGFFGLTVETLERVYGHHHPQHQSGVRDILGRGGRAPGSLRAVSPEHNGKLPRLLKAKS